MVSMSKQHAVDAQWTWLVFQGPNWFVEDILRGEICRGESQNCQVNTCNTVRSDTAGVVTRLRPAWVACICRTNACWPKESFG
jgi:hypothetical protein